MGLGLPAAVRRETLNRWNALLDAPPSDASHTYVDVPAMLRKTVPQQALLPVKWGASKMATAYLGGDSTRYCFFAFDTPANHHSLRARVAVKRSPMATQAQLAAYAAGKLPKQVLVGGRLFLRGAEPYPPGESDSWTTSTPLCLARAMATPRDKLRYYTLFYEALCDRACEAQGPLLVELDGPAQDADVVVIRCAPLDPLDGRSAVTRHHRPRDVRYGEADLKVPRRLPARQPPARARTLTDRPPARRFSTQCATRRRAFHATRGSSSVWTRTWWPRCSSRLRRSGRSGLGWSLSSRRTQREANAKLWTVVAFRPVERKPFVSPCCSMAATTRAARSALGSTRRASSSRRRSTPPSALRRTG